jgi:hypothetical protein
MTSQPISFFSEGVRLAGDLFLPDGLNRSDTRARIVLCHGRAERQNSTHRPPGRSLSAILPEGA